MPRSTTRGRGLISGARSPQFDLSNLFPDAPGIKRGPFPKQRWVYEKIRSGEARGGGIVYQGGKGCAKTICGCAAIVLVHHRPEFRGCTSVICRESYPAHMTSTWDEFKQMLDRMPSQLVKSVSRPSHNSMGIIEWAYGGTTLFISLSDEKTWASANIGFAWVDEAHLQNAIMVDKLCDRLRQEAGPRTALLTSNPFGRCYFWDWANPDSEKKRPNWHWIQSSMFENPALPKDYIARMEAKYPPGTPGHRRWVLGLSAALEGTVFEAFVSEPEECIHVVPAIELPEEWPRGRGLDWGLDNPCVVVWGAYDQPKDSWWIYRTHTQAGRPAKWHAGVIRDLEADEWIRWVPSDPEIFRRVHWPDGSIVPKSTADEFRENGVRVTAANNDRVFGLNRLLDLIAVMPDEYHPITLKKGRPHLFILDTPENRPVIHNLATARYRPAPTTGNTDSPDDVMKKDDHWYDGVRYLVAEVRTGQDKAPFPGRPANSYRDRRGR